MRIRPLAALSAAALSAVLLAGCATSTPEATTSPSAPPAADLCEAAAPSGAASDAVTVEGEVGEESTATFEFPLEITELQTTVVEEGAGDPAEAGQLVTYALT
ncbi:MAG: FKBP-type peptidyl-prolyl cis-trans isomerase, partial [Microbacterium sp.]